MYGHKLVMNKGKMTKLVTYGKVVTRTSRAACPACTTYARAGPAIRRGSTWGVRPPDPLPLCAPASARFR
uniref:Uncharacterized protein n=1 Tax=Arundo donax TaxID=35708 RepID=A0A0A9E7Z3_ARUDO